MQNDEKIMFSRAGAVAADTKELRGDAPTELVCAYRYQRNRATARGIAWEFDFDSWLKVWVGSGFLHLRGRGVGCYVMARNGDVGPYSASNVQIITYEKNARDARTNNPKTVFEYAKRHLGLARGWTFVAGKYQVMVGGKYLGRFATPESAKAAYLAASAKRLQQHQ